MPSQAELALLLTAQDNISKVLKSARGEVQQIGEAVQKSGRHVDEFNLRTRNYSSGLGNLGFIATGATVAIIGLGAAAIGAGVKSIMLAANMEQSKIAFTTMLGSAEKADTFIKELFDFAAHTPFEFVGLQESSKRLLAYGFTAEQIIPTLTAVGNAAAGLGASQETIGRITLALGQMQAKGKVSGEEMRQLAEVGIPAWELLAKAIGKDIPEAMKLAEKGAIPAAGAVQALIQGMSQKFPDMMEKQSHTLVGVWSTAKDDMTQILTR